MRPGEYLRLKVDYCGRGVGRLRNQSSIFFLYPSIWCSGSLGSLHWNSVLRRRITIADRHHDTPLFPTTRPRPSPMGVPRIPYTLPFPPPKIRPPNATTLSAAIAAITDFLQSRNTVFLTGAGISVESGLADYRGEKGTYRLNQKYRPIFFEEFAGNHESRKRYVLPRRRLLHLANWLQVLGEELHRVAVNGKGTAK